MREELKSCPFCGGEVAIALGGDDTYQWYFITRGNRENKCTCRLFMESERFYKNSGKKTKMTVRSDLINRWNRRVCRCGRKENLD